MNKLTKVAMTTSACGWGVISESRTRLMFMQPAACKAARTFCASIPSLLRPLHPRKANLRGPHPMSGDLLRGPSCDVGALAFDDDGDLRTLMVAMEFTSRDCPPKVTCQIWPEATGLVLLYSTCSVKSTWELIVDCLGSVQWDAAARLLQ